MSLFAIVWTGQGAFFGNEFRTVTPTLMLRIRVVSFHTDEVAERLYKRSVRHNQEFLNYVFFKFFDVIWGLIHFWKLITINIKNFPQFLRKFSTNGKIVPSLPFSSNSRYLITERTFLVDAIKFIETLFVEIWTDKLRPHFSVKNSTKKHHTSCRHSFCLNLDRK